MRHIFRKNYNLIIKNFIPMCLRREQHYPSHIAVLYRLRVIRVKLCRIEKQPRTKFNPIWEVKKDELKVWRILNEIVCFLKTNKVVQMNIFVTIPAEYLRSPMKNMEAPCITHWKPTSWMFGI